MTPMLLLLLIGLSLYGLYIAARTARLGSPPGEFLNGGNSLPAWAPMFLLPALVVSGLDLERHLLLVADYGLQAAHLAVGIVLAAMAALLVWNRLWFATRVAGLETPGEALGKFYGSITFRIVILGLAVLFALPFSANLLSFAATTLESATNGVIPRIAGVWLLAISLAIPAIIGGWRATIVTLAMQAVLLALLLPGSALFAEVTFQGAGFPAVAIGVADGVFWDRIPGVIQYSAGVGKEVPTGGLFTTVALSSWTLALLGVVLSPAALYLGQTTRQGGSLGLSAVWLTAGLASGILLIAAPVLASRMPTGTFELVEQFFSIEPLAGAAFVLLLLIGPLLAISFFVTGGTLLFVREFVLAFLLPALSPNGQRFAARVALGVCFFLLAMMAAFMPLVSAILGSLALPMTVQIIPALLGLTLFRWISRGAVLAGLIVGLLIVFFTEPAGLILFEGLFVDLPWGRWPLTIHSAAWGLEINLMFVLLASAVTLKSADRYERDRLHDAMYEATRLKPGGRGPFWAMLLLWAFLAYGPGAVLGNTFFSDPIFSPTSATLGIPSLWVWQILFWLLGVVLVWWLAYRLGLGRTSFELIKPIEVGGTPGRKTPDWLAAGLSRVVARQNRARAPARRTG